MRPHGAFSLTAFEAVNNSNLFVNWNSLRYCRTKHLTNHSRTVVCPVASYLLSQIRRWIWFSLNGVTLASPLAPCRPHALSQGEDVTYDDARTRETNILSQLTYFDRCKRSYNFIFSRQSLIQAQVALHLGLRSTSECQISRHEDWLQGAFNLCVPVFVNGSKRALIRFPFPYRVGDGTFGSGNCDEKVLSMLAYRPVRGHNGRRCL